MYSADIRLVAEDIHPFLCEYFSYYNTLDGRWQKLFAERVIEFSLSKNFVSQKGFTINNKVKAIVSASAVQLTLGLERWQMSYFETILLFPTDFFNHYSGLGLKGETNLNGFMSFSWTSFINGYKIQNDNLNLGLHEFTHALRFNSVRGESNDEFFERYFPKWYNYAKKEFLNLKSGKPSVFRKYGGTNINEFLSVVVEHFFESPAEFQKEQPLLYSATAILLNQKTNGAKTLVGIRQSELEQMGQTVPFTVKGKEPPFLKNNSALASIIFLCVAVFSHLRSGMIISFPVLLLLLLSVIYYLSFDYRYGWMSLVGDQIELSKGYFLFRNRKSYPIKPHHLIKTEIYTNDEREQTMVFSFFDEAFLFKDIAVRTALSQAEQKKLTEEFEKNYVWVSKSV